MKETTSGGRVSTVKMAQLSSQDIESWHALRSGNRLLGSPYFDPAFSAAVNDCGFPVNVIIDRNSSGQIEALLPIHLQHLISRPVGWPAADFQGPIHALGRSSSVSNIVKQAGIHLLEFDHLLDLASGGAPWVRTRRPSPFLDINGGLDGYLGRASASGKDGVKRARGAARRAEEQHGAIRFVLDNKDPRVLNQVIDLKREQYRKTGAKDFFADERRRTMVHKLMQSQEPGCRGLLSTIHAGPTLISGHFGIASRDILHWWFPAYDTAYSQFRPGWMMLRELIIALPQTGITRLDLGRGEDEYKRRSMTGAVEVGQGVVGRAPYTTAHDIGRRLESVVRKSPVGTKLRTIVRSRRHA